MSIFDRHGQPNLVCTWHVCMQGLTLASEQVKFGLANRGYSWASCLPGSPYHFLLLLSFLTSYRWCGSWEPGVLHRLHAQQFDWLCFLFCPSLKGKDVPTLLQDCTSLCLDNHETGWETEILSPCPLPPLEKKNVKTELGLFRSWGGARLGENSPFPGCWMSRF